MNSKTEASIHPDAVLESLLAKGGRSHRRENLRKVHEICRKQYASGSRDFTLPAIGRLAQEAGIINAPSADYQGLLASWAAYAGPPTPKPTKTLASYEYLMRIPDPAIRSIMQSIITERDKLKAQLNTLKSNTHVTVDRRPLGVNISSATGSQPVLVLPGSSQLTDSQRDALKKAISPAYLEEQGWREGDRGEIFNDRGRIVLPISFATAIRRILGQ
jgi:hypothetical protein